jgi:hypothetical protein
MSLRRAKCQDERTDGLAGWLNDWLVKVNVKLSLCLTKHRAMKTYLGVEVELHAFLTSALDGGEWTDWLTVSCQVILTLTTPNPMFTTMAKAKLNT